jgi:hypothetical protein
VARVSRTDSYSLTAQKKYVSVGQEVPLNHEGSDCSRIVEANGRGAIAGGREKAALDGRGFREIAIGVSEISRSVRRCDALRRIRAPNIQILFVARGYNWNVFLARYAVEGGAQVLHLLAVEAGQRNLHRLVRVQFGQVFQNVGDHRSMFPFAALRNIHTI